MSGRVPPPEDNRPRVLGYHVLSTPSEKLVNYLKDLQNLLREGRDKLASAKGRVAELENDISQIQAEISNAEEALNLIAASGPPKVRPIRPLQ
jgi:hypothetical protein